MTRGPANSAAAAVLATSAAICVTAAAACAQLMAGAIAPPFAALAARGGNVVEFNLQSALRSGPVVLYFFPKAFTTGCTIEAHAFSQRIGEFRRLGATVIGVSGDDIATQRRFSTQECRSHFLVASDLRLAIAAKYRAAAGALHATRTSYVIGQNDRIIEAYSATEPLGHIDHALRALRAVSRRLARPGRRT